MFTYIKKNVPGYYVEIEEKLSPELYSDLGESYEDFLKNKWVLLTDAQLEFHKLNPDANVREVWNMELTQYVEPERTLEQAKEEKLMEIAAYNISEAVDSFTINRVITAWFKPSERTNYALSINAAKLLNQNTLTFPVGDNVLQVETSKAELMLSAIQLYADACYMVTKQHQIEVNALEDIDAVDSFDVALGYPEKLNFDLE